MHCTFSLAKDIYQVTQYMAKNSNRKDLTEKFRQAASTSTGRVHVVPSHDGWSVKKEGSKRATVVMATKQGAVKAATGLKYATRIIVHKKDGTIQKNAKVK